MSRLAPPKPAPARVDLDGTQESIRSGKSRAVAKAILARFPKTMARLAK